MRRRREERGGIFSKKNLMGIFIVMIMVLSGLGYMATRDSNGTGSNLDYNGFKFSNPDYYTWYASINGTTAKFTYHPKEIEHMQMSADAAAMLASTRMAYITFDPADRDIEQIELVRMQLEQDLSAYFKMYPITGVVNVTKQYASFPKIGCYNATYMVPVIYLRHSDDINQSRITNTGPCIMVEAASANDFPALKDRLLYGMFKIIA
jgi:hypothetical protein